MIKLTLTDEQAKVVSTACEFYARVMNGQFEEITWNAMTLRQPMTEDFCTRRETANRLIMAARQYIYPDLAAGSYYGYGKFQDSDLAFDTYQVVRTMFGDKREPFTHSKPPKCERIIDE
jgi:hypothetical protein